MTQVSRGCIGAAIVLAMSLAAFAEPMEIATS